ncbi:unnamed protein product [Owenia fusiformis]|uniref:Uncharacterized protein n=1 Tax=Owenia fusiformis TaxID=6347 RepID=A0A8J1UCK5_OWEFU|nr:unnamed protein product [Owenia fusiformis]
MDLCFDDTTIDQLFVTMKWQSLNVDKTKMRLLLLVCVHFSFLCEGETGDVGEAARQSIIDKYRGKLSKFANHEGLYSDEIEARLATLDKVSLLKNDEYVNDFKSKLQSMISEYDQEDVESEPEPEEESEPEPEEESEEEEDDDEDVIYLEDEEWDMEYWDEHLCATDHDDIIPDNVIDWNVTDRARKTMPPGFRISNSTIPGANLGVFAEAFIPSGTYMGPYEGEVIYDDEDLYLNADYAFKIYKNNQLLFFRDAWHPDTSSWVRYVNCARDMVEQNLEPIQCEDHIYYRAIQPIKPGQELFVFYGEGYVEKLGIAMRNYCKWYNGTLHDGIGSDYTCEDID